MGDGGRDERDAFDVNIEVNRASGNRAGLALLLEFFTNVSCHGLLDDAALNSDAPLARVEAFVEGACDEHGQGLALLGRERGQAEKSNRTKIGRGSAVFEWNIISRFVNCDVFQLNSENKSGVGTRRSRVIMSEATRPTQARNKTSAALFKIQTVKFGLANVMRYLFAPSRAPCHKQQRAATFPSTGFVVPYGTLT